MDEVDLIVERERGKRRRLRNLRAAIALVALAFHVIMAIAKPAVAGPILTLAAIFVVVWLVGEYCNREDD